MTRLFVFLALLILLLSACVPQVRLPRCNGVLVAPDEVVTAEHCVGVHGGRIYQGSELKLAYVPLRMDKARDVAHVTLDRPVWSPYYAVYREPTVGTTGYVFGGCPYRDGAMFRVIATERQVGADGAARWAWSVRGGHITCPGDSGSPVWSDDEFGVYYGIVSRYEPLRTQTGGVPVVWEVGTITYTGAGE